MAQPERDPRGQVNPETLLTQHFNAFSTHREAGRLEKGDNEKRRLMASDHRGRTACEGEKMEVASHRGFEPLFPP